jgi:hypothetical protein
MEEGCGKHAAGRIARVALVRQPNVVARPARNDGLGLFRYPHRLISQPISLSPSRSGSLESASGRDRRVCRRRVPFGSSRRGSHRVRPRSYSLGHTPEPLVACSDFPHQPLCFGIRHSVRYGVHFSRTLSSLVFVKWLGQHVRFFPSRWRM